MDHKLAENSGTVERYLLNELSRDELVAFEEHLFDCPICADSVRTGAAAIDNLKQVLREAPQPAAEASMRKSMLKRWNWSAWMRPAVLAPSAAALALAGVVSYQTLVYIPSLERPEVLSSNVIAPVARGGGPVIALDRSRPFFDLNFEVDAPKVYPLYTCDFELQGKGSVLKMDSGPQQFASFTLNLLVPEKLFPVGRYVMRIRPQGKPDVEIERYEFVIQ